MGVYMGYGMMAVAGFLGWYLCKRKKRRPPLAGYLPVLGAVGFLCLILAILEGSFGGSGMVEELPRQELGDQQITLLLDVGGAANKEDYPITVEEQKLTEAQKKALMEAAVQELELELLGEQKDAVSVNLSIPDTLQSGRVQAALTFWPGDVIDGEGVIHWEYFDEKEPLVQVSALLECQDTELIHEFYLRLERPVLSERESFYAGLKEQLSKENQRMDTSRFVLPTEVLGTPVEWYQEQEQAHWKLLLLGMVGVLIHYIVGKSKRDQKKKEWQNGLTSDYPDIVSRLSLLVGAGMTVSGAIGKLASEYKRSRTEKRRVLRPGYEELLRTWNEIQDGTGERKAYENLGIRCNQQQYRKLSSLLIQNVRKGAKGIQQLLDAEVTEVYLQQQADVKRRGEEAAAKLLLPMGIMLLLVFAILIVPAMFSLHIS